MSLPHRHRLPFAASRLNIHVLLASLIALAVSTSAVGRPPPNDGCSSASTVSGFGMVTYNINLSDATLAPCEAYANCVAGSTHSVWYSFTPSEDGLLDVEATSDTFLAVVSVHDGCASPQSGCQQPAQLACDANEGGLFDTAFIFNLPVEAGETYLVRLAANGSNAGYVDEFNISFHPHPANDDCANATVFTGADYQASVNATGAYIQACEDVDSICFGDPPITKSVWFRYNATWTGTLNLDTRGSLYPTVLSAFDGCAVNLGQFGCVMPAELACAQGPYYDGAQMSLPVVAGESYLIRAAAGGYSDSYSLDIEAGFVPGNDVCSTATVITGNTYNPPAIPIHHASAIANEPQEHCESFDNGVGHSVFYKFTPQQDGLASMNTIGSDYDTVLSVFDGCGMIILPNGYIQPTLLACNNDLGGFFGTLSGLSSVPMEAGHTYVIKVASNHLVPNQSAMLDFTFQFAPAPDCVGDIVSNDVVDVNDLLAVITAWGSCPVPCPPRCAADIAGSSCMVNVDDLLAVVTHWGPCP